MKELSYVTGFYDTYLVTNGTPVYKVIDAPKVDPYNLTNGTDCNAKTFENQFPNTSASCVMAGLEENVHLLRMQIFHLFGWFWIMNFIIALGQCVLAGAFASWYFTYQKPDIDRVGKVFNCNLGRNSVRYHTGSLAFGAAIIAIVQLIRAILEYIDAKLKGKARFSDIFWRETWQRNEDLPVVNSG
ncbi:Choline transporter-like protein 4 [Acropora cervicornis]|uniref:Choline transporter-like protein n=1 Tax=Acropora cervicornis TaxID=6130 RepID=A0AAD9VA67_ACRCE|nr:Choline transporter-like protein 4 [Acropora cervicornis]